MTREEVGANETKLRLLTVAALDRNPLGGAAGTLISCNDALRRQGHVVDEIWNDRLPKRRIRHQNLYSLLEKPKAFAKVVEDSSLEYDAILINEPHGYMVPSVLRSKARGALVITISQGIEKRIDPILSYWRKRLEPTKQEAPRSFLTPVMSWLLNRHWDKAAKECDGFMVVNNDDKDFLISQQNVDQAKIHLWKSGLDPAFHTNPQPVTSERLRRIIYVGQTAFYKHPGLVIEAVSSILQSDVDARFTWITQAEHHAGLRDRFPERVRPQIQFLPWMDQASLVQQFDQHGIMIFPTIVEGFGRAALEAMSRGLCVVSSRSSGMKDYIQDGKNGILCEVGQTSAFVTAVQELLRNLTFSGSISKNAVTTASDFEWDTVAAELATFLLDIKIAITSMDIMAVLVQKVAGLELASCGRTIRYARMTPYIP